MERYATIFRWGPLVEPAERIWVCGDCGMKVYYGRLALPPRQQCLCGGMSWRRRRRTLVGRI